MNNIRSTEDRVDEVKKKNHHDMMLRKELENMKRQDRLDQAGRVQRQQQYERERMMEKIKADDLKTQKLLDQKSSLMEMKVEVKIQAEREKAKMMDKFIKGNRNNRSSQSLIRKNKRFGSSLKNSESKTKRKNNVRSRDNFDKY